MSYKNIFACDLVQGLVIELLFLFYYLIIAGREAVPVKRVTNKEAVV